MRKAVVVRQRVELAARSRDQALIGKPQRRTPEPCHAFDVFAALVIVDMDAAAARYYDRTLFLMLAQVRERVQRVQLVQLSQSRGLVHRAPRSSHAGGVPSKDTRAR